MEHSIASIAKPGFADVSGAADTIAQLKYKADESDSPNYVSHDPRLCPHFDDEITLNSGRLSSP